MSDDDSPFLRKSMWKRGEWKLKIRAVEAMATLKNVSHNTEFPVDAEPVEIRVDALKACGFGHPLLDISVNVDEPFLAKYNVEKGSVGLATDEQQDLFPEIAKLPGVQFIPGGAAMNTMRVCRWMLGTDAGAIHVHFVGAIGDDDFGRKLRESLEKASIQPVFHVADGRAPLDRCGREVKEGGDASAARRAKLPTGTCASLVTDKNRSLVTNLAAAREVPAAFFHDEAVRRILQECEVFYMEGFFFNIISCPQAHQFIAGIIAASSGKVLLANISAPFLCHVFKAEWLLLLQHIDVLIGNETDWHTFGTVVMGWDADTPIEFVAARTAALPTARGSLHPFGGRVVIVTRGVQSTVASWWDGPVMLTRQFPVALVSRDKVVDDCGAGDSFAGGFIAGLALRRSIPECISAGMFASSINVQYQGCQVPELCTYDWSTRSPFFQGDPIGEAEWVTRGW